METKRVMAVLKEFCREKMDKKEVVRSLEDVEPIDLYMAEVELIGKGFTNKDLKEIADIYQTLLSGRSKELYKQLNAEHPLKILMAEHEKLRSFLYVMDDIRENISQTLTEGQKVNLELATDNLYELDKHIKREEEAIFPRLNEKDLKGRTILLSEEHGEIQDLRSRLKSLLTDEGDADEIIPILDDMIYLLREHSFIENDLLYPVVFDVLDDWDEITAECDKIGRCEFVPIS